VIENLLAQFLPHYRSGVTRVSRFTSWKMVALVCPGGWNATKSDRHLPAGDDRFRGRLLYPIHVLAVLPQRHLLSRRAVLDITELAEEPLLRLAPTFASHGWFEAACQVAHIRPRVLLESVAPHTLIALAQAGHGIAVLPSPVRIPRTGIRVAVVLHRGVPIGRWTVAAWDPQRFLTPYAVQFVDEVVAYCQRGYPGREHIRRASQLPKPKSD
jgi:LysR family cyn operon transcriptional activator